MPFPFTFSFSVPGLHNPFTVAAKPAVQWPRTDRQDASVAKAISRHNHAFPPSRLASPSPSLVPLTRKRGWVPSFPEPSLAATSATSIGGYLDTPAKYRHMVHEAPEREVEEMFAELPPAKRRRTLAGSIVSTALSAALLGTAVGLTVYRLWRDRGKEPEQTQTLPPPYHPGDWIPEQDIQVIPPTPKSRKPRHTPSSVRRAATKHRKVRSRGRPITPPRSISPALMAPPPPEFDFVHVNPAEEEEAGAEGDEMDWIGDRLSELIEEGKRALSTEVVVMSEAKEDEVDDGSGDWEEEQPVAGPSVSRRGSMRRTHRPRDIQLPSSYPAFPIPPSPSLSPRKRKFVGEAVHLSPHRGDCSGLPVPSTPRWIVRESSRDADPFTPATGSFKEDESAWQSPELRESMERARAQYLEKRMSERS
ncbi:hypothetical protein K503DRAFT_695886 [Rhizopogon vinicolor AM-OR11-026]|uniref:Uncharacterized protein n=1 Tax=Rhizopogon vinicolor AM-OR11-026 TaxID=1314800 RepID=A0A1B7MTS2_9AGAM|nr:hypothetical protein K503DRAFT_695886 [Rhizopogon vinicolor AM-OR11-026]